MIHYNTTKRFTALIIILFIVSMLFVPNSFSRSVLATSFTTGMIIPLSHPGTILDSKDANQTITIMSAQNNTLTMYQNTTEPIEGFSNIVCKSGYEYVQMTGQYTAGNISYKVIFLQMILLDENGYVLAKGFGHVDNVDAHKTTPFNAIARYPSTFSSCIIQIDNAIPK